MRKTLQPLLALGFVLLSYYATAADDLKTQRIKSSYVLAFGRAPDAGEIKHWRGQGDLNMAALMDRHRAFIAAGYQDFVITRSYVDAFGRMPSEDEKKYWRQYNQTYTELMKNHVKWLVGNSEYDKVITRAFRYVAGRSPESDELTRWKAKGVKSYVILVGLLQDSKKQAEKTGTKKLLGLEDWLSAASTALSFIFVSKSVATEINALIGNDAGSLVAAGGGNVMIRADLIGNDAGSLIGNDAGSLVAAGAGNMVAAGGGN